MGEREERTPYMPWKEEIRTQQNENVNNILHQVWKSEKRGIEEKTMDSTRHRGHTELLMEKARASPESIDKGIHKNQGR